MIIKYYIYTCKCIYVYINTCPVDRSLQFPTSIFSVILVLQSKSSGAIYLVSLVVLWFVTPITMASDPQNYRW